MNFTSHTFTRDCRATDLLVFGKHSYDTDASE